MSAAYDTRRPAWVERTSAWVAGEPSTRLVVVLRAVGCAHALRPDGGCTNCGFLAMSTAGTPVSDEDLIAQIDSALATPGALEGVGEVDLFNSGSFLSDREIPAAVRRHAFALLAASPVRRVLVESRPEHVALDKLSPLRAMLGERALEVGIGLESADDRVRETLVRKGFGKADFERAARVLAEARARLLAYVLLKPLGLGEREAIEDAVASAAYVFEVAARCGVPTRVALQPTFVAPGTALEREMLEGRYEPPSLWSVVEVVRRAHGLGEIAVGMSDEGLEPRRAPAGCPHCTGPLREAIAQYNRTLRLEPLERAACECRGAGSRCGAPVL